MDAMTLQALWKAHKERRFPALPQGVTVQGIDLVFLDALASGCVASVVLRGATCDAKKVSLLSDLTRQIKDACGFLTGDAKEYFEHLERLAVTALDVAQDTRAC